MAATFSPNGYRYFVAVGGVFVDDGTTDGLAALEHAVATRADSSVGEQPVTVVVTTDDRSPF